MKELISFIIIGLLAGWLAGQITKGRGFGAFRNLVIGLIGSLVGGFLGQLIGLQAVGFLGRVAMALGGALLLLAVVGIKPKRLQR